MTDSDRQIECDECGHLQFTAILHRHYVELSCDNVDGCDGFMEVMYIHYEDRMDVI